MSIKRDYQQSPNYSKGKWNKDMIVLHWWDNPAKKPSYSGVLSWFKMKRAQVSAHYVVEAGRFTQMVLEKDMAWHAGNGAINRRSIGIEINPRLSDGDYHATAYLVADIWKRRGRLPLRRHREFTTTSCPGTLDVGRVQREAEAILNGGTAPSVKPAAVQPKPKEGGPRKAGSAPWPDAYLTVTGKRNQYQDKALKKLLGDVGYTGTLAMRLQRRLRKAGTYKGYITWASRIGPSTTKAWQQFLAAPTGPNGKRFYTGRIDGKWGTNTVTATVNWLNWQAEFYHD